MRDPEQVTTSPKGTFFTFENMNEAWGCGSIIVHLSNTALCVEPQHYKIINNNNEEEEQEEEEECLRGLYKAAGSIPSTASTRHDGAHL